VIADDVIFLLDYDRWATRRLFGVTDGLDPAVWSRTQVVDERGLGGILVHQLGALMRWRHRLQRLEGELPRPERGPLSSPGELARLFEAEWARYEQWQTSWTDEMMAYRANEVPIWQLLVHVVNHGTQHRSEAAALLTAEGRSPGDLDLVIFAEEGAESG
jgi:uncharacterized damage-inducible protein DinB